MGTLVQSVGYTAANAPRIKRESAALSDGSTIHLVVDKNMITGSADYNTGVKAYIYHIPVGGTATLKATVALNSPSAAGEFSASICVDASNNFHLVWAGQSTSPASAYHALQYCKGTYNAVGPTFTPGSVVVIHAATTNFNFDGVDIDVSGTGDNPVIAAIRSNALAGSISSQPYLYCKNNAGTWVTSNFASVAVVSTSAVPFPQLEASVACRQEAHVSNKGEIIFLHTRRATSGDQGDFIYNCEFDFSGSTFPAIGQMLGPINTGKNVGNRRTWIFYAGNDKYIVAGTSQSNPWLNFVAAFSTSVTAGLVQLVNLTSSSNGPSTLTIASFNNLNPTSVYFNKADQRLVFIAAAVATPAYGIVQVARLVLGATLATSSVTFSPIGNYEAQYMSKYTYLSVGPSEFFGGAGSRNTNYNSLYFLMTYFGGTSWTNIRREFWNPALPEVPPDPFHAADPTGLHPLLVPASGSTITTDRPALSIGINAQTDDPPYRVQGRWQLATNSGFTTGLRTIVQNNNWISAYGTDARQGVAVSNGAVDAPGELFQGTWYIRAAAEDEAGGLTAYGTANSFTVSHPPAAATLSPTGSATLLYGTGQETFTWTFTDPSPYDSQTAYEILIENNATGASVLDTGKIVSTAKTAVLTIPSGSKDTLLRWRIRLWDSDDVVGPDSAQNLFLVSDPPAPTITSPTTGGTVTNAIPTITWTTGLAIGKAQTAYSITIKQGATTVYASGWVSSAALSAAIPAGYLHNTQNYSITLALRDNLNLEGSVTNTFNTVWTLPAAPTGAEVYLSEYAKRGYVWITVFPTTVDADFIAWNLYRRKYGETSWTLIQQFYNPTVRMTYRDYFAGTNETYDYAFTQMVNRFGDIVESDYQKIRTVTPQNGGYWLFDITDPNENTNRGMPLYIVTDDSYDEEYEQETYNVIGRGRHTDYGERLGYNGALAAQLRDLQQGGITRINYVLNPTMVARLGSSSTPRNWVWSINGTFGSYAEDYVSAEEPSPTGVDEAYRMTVLGQGNTTSDYVQVVQTIPKVQMPPAIAGQLITFSAWIYTTALTGIRLMMEVQDASNAVLATVSTVNPTVQETYIPSSLPVDHPDYGSGNFTGNWKRVAVSVAWPASGVPDHIVLRIRREQGNGTITLTTAGTQLDLGALTPYFDGLQYGGQWLGEEMNSQSFTNGYYTARQQRQDLENLKAEKSFLYLRNPFGDVWNVSTGNIGVKRIPGVGNSEFVDLNIPYTEVAF